MAEQHNFQTQGPKSYYNSKGELTWCHSKEDVARAMQNGFTSANYVPSKWPTTLFHKKTGETKTVGKLDLTDEQNEALVKAQGDDWTTEHVQAPEKPKKGDAAVVVAADSSTNALILATLLEIKATQESQGKRLDGLETILDDVTKQSA